MTTTKTAPQIVIVAGPNGAGKTTLSPTLLEGRFREFPYINADAIASGLSSFAPETVAIEAGRVMLGRLKALAEARENFAFETTLSARSYAPWLGRLRNDGYEVNLLFIWLRSAELAVQRVAERIRRGGHAIPPDDIRRRYERGIANLLDVYIPLADGWAVYDNSVRNSPVLIATGRIGLEPKITRSDLWQAMR